MAKTVVALYEEYDHAQSAINELLREGFARDAVSLIASNSDGSLHAGHGVDSLAIDPVIGGTLAGAGQGAAIGGLTGLAAGIISLLIPGLGPVLAFGPLAAALTGAGLGAVGGGIIGGLANLGIPEEEAGYYAEGLRRGGVLVTVRAEDDRADTARLLLDQAGAVDIEEKGGWYRASGYNGYSPDAPLYSPEDLNAERNNFATAPRSDSSAELNGSRVHALHE